MSRKIRTPKERTDLPPAWKYSLMVGRPPTVRLHGWYAFELDAIRTPDGCYDWTAAGDRLWAAHGAALTAEAASCGFIPFWHAKKKPRGDGYTAWVTAFLQQHRY
jgi:hypothetical protein